MVLQSFRFNLKEQRTGVLQKVLIINGDFSVATLSGFLGAYGTWSLFCSCSQMYRIIIAGDSWNPVSIQQNWLIWPSSMGYLHWALGAYTEILSTIEMSIFPWQRIIDVGLLKELPKGTVSSRTVPFM